jgi:hypothetical protein
LSNVCTDLDMTGRQACRKVLWKDPGQLYEGEHLGTLGHEGYDLLPQAAT